jgi:hypothetical protein
MAIGAARLPAQETAPLVLHLPASTRASGLGDAWVAGRGPDILFYNPAQLSPATGVAISVARYGSAGRLGSLGTSMKAGKFGVAAGVQWLGYHAPAGEFASRPGVVAEDGPQPATSLATTVAGSTEFKGFRWGLGIKYLEQRVDELLASGVGVDAGVARDFGRTTTLGLSVRNVGPALEAGTESPSLPTRIALGATRLAPIGTWFDLLLTADAGWENEVGVVGGAGAELIYVPVGGWSFVGRVGARRVDRSELPAQYPVTFGASFWLDRFGIDYGYEPFSGSSGGHRIGLRLGQ